MTVQAIAKPETERRNVQLKDPRPAPHDGKNVSRVILLSKSAHHRSKKNNDSLESLTQPDFENTRNLRNVGPQDP